MTSKVSGISVSGVQTTSRRLAGTSLTVQGGQSPNTINTTTDGTNFSSTIGPAPTVSGGLPNQIGGNSQTGDTIASGVVSIGLAAAAVWIGIKLIRR